MPMWKKYGSIYRVVRSPDDRPTKEEVDALIAEWDKLSDDEFYAAWKKTDVMFLIATHRHEGGGKRMVRIIESESHLQERAEFHGMTVEEYKRTGGWRDGETWQEYRRRIGRDE